MKFLLIRLFFSAFTLLFLWIAFQGCQSDIKTATIELDSVSQAMMTAKDIDVIFSDSGYLQARVSGPVVKRFEGESPWLEFPEGFRTEMYDSAQRIETTITADYGKRMEITRVMEAKGNVIVRNELKNEQLNTEILIWNELRHTIRTNAPVKITTPDKVLYGTGLEANETFTNYTILHPRGEMSVEGDSL